MDSDVTSKKPADVKIEPELDDAMELVKQYGPTIGIAVLLALVVGGALLYHRHNKEVTRERASELFMTAQSAAEFQDVVDRYPRTPAAPMALLAAAAEWYREGVADIAERLYRQFMEQYPEHPMFASAELGLAHTLEAQGNMTEALSLFESRSRADDHLAPLALLSKARVSAALGHTDVALDIYTGILEDPDHPWRAQARTDKLYLEKRLRAAN